ESFIPRFKQTVAYPAQARSRAAHVHHRQIMRMVAAGLTIDEATNAHTVLSAYTRGYVLVEHLHEADLASIAGREGMPLDPIPGGYRQLRRAAARTTPDENF